jgi:hypothetical protein
MEDRATETKEGTTTGKTGIPITTSAGDERLQSWYFTKKLY